jgi:epoxyqueuosine reductase QueG
VLLPDKKRMITRLSEVWPDVERIARDNGGVRRGASDITDEHSALFDEWLDRGHYGSMHYLTRTRDARRDPHARFLWAKSAIVILVPYASTRPDAPPNALSHFIARYALDDD